MLNIFSSLPTILVSTDSSIAIFRAGKTETKPNSQGTLAGGLAKISDKVGVANHGQNEKTVRVTQNPNRLLQHTRTVLSYITIF